MDEISTRLEITLVVDISWRDEHLRIGGDCLTKDKVIAYVIIRYNNA